MLTELHAVMNLSYISDISPCTSNTHLMYVEVTLVLSRSGNYIRVLIIT